MECPKCKGEFEEKKFGSYTISRCKNCQGLLITPGYTHKLAHTRELVAMMDIGSAKQGKKYNRIEDITCPRCRIPMDKIGDAAQPHVWVETCAGCGHTFLDAGELTDLSEETLVDKIKDFFQGRR